MKNSTKNLFIAVLLIASINVYSQPSSYNPVGIGGGGAQFAPSINPANTNEMYVSCDMSPLFHTLDGGATWSIIDYHYINASHATHVEFTNNPLIQYCMNNDPSSGNYTPIKTTDGGVTWAPITDPTAGNGAWFTVANPQNSNQVIVTDYSNFYFSSNGGTTFGTSFYNYSNGAYIAGTFWDGLNIYICTDRGLLISTNGGTSWTGPALSGIPSTEQIVTFAGAKTGSTTRFFCITWSSGNVYPGCVGSDAGYYQKVYSMDYTSSATWTPKINGITAPSDNPFCVGMASNDTSTAYIAGENNSTGYPIVLKTTNGGTTWVHSFNTSTNQNIETGYCGQGGDFQWTWPQYIYGISVAASDPNKVIFCDMGFTHKTIDGGTTWQAAYVPAADLNPVNAATPTRHYYHGNGIEPTSCWDIIWTDATHIFAGYTDIHALRSNDAGTTWGFDYSGLNTYNTVYKFLNSTSSNTIYAATSSIHDIYESTHLADNTIESGTGAIMMSTDNGATFTTMHNFGKPVIWLAFDPNNANKMYASVISHTTNNGGIWVSSDIQNGATSTWTHLSSPVRTQGHPFNIRILNDGTIVTSYSGRRISTSPTFTDSSGVFVSTDGGTTWADRSDAGMKYWNMDVVIDPFDATQNTWYSCVFSGWGGPANGLGGLYRTTNRGVSWTKLTGSTQDRVYSLTFDPVHTGVAYMTTETNGLWTTQNINATIPVWTQDMHYPFRQPNRVYFNPFNQNEVWVNSFGNGIRMGTLVPAGIDENTISDNTVTIYPNPFTETTTIYFSEIQKHATVKITDVLGKEVKTVILSGARNLTIDKENMQAGIYFVSIIDDNGSAGSPTKNVINRKIIVQ